MCNYYEYEGVRISNKYGVNEYDIKSLIVNNRKIAEQTVSVKYYGPFELLLTLNDGHKLIYDLEDNTTHRKYNTEDDIPNDIFTKEFARRLRRKMLHKHIDQSELAERVGVSQGTISSYIRGIRTPTYLIINKIAKVLECDMNDFIY